MRRGVAAAGVAGGARRPNHDGRGLDQHLRVDRWLSVTRGVMEMARLTDQVRGISWGVVLGHLLLVFTGVTLALWFNNLNQERHNRQHEIRILRDLVAALESDTADLSLNLRSDEASRRSIEVVLKHLGTSMPYHDSLDQHFGLMSRFTNFLPNTASYEELRAGGFRLIRNDDLRLRIIQYYEYDGRYLQAIEQVFLNTNWLTALKPTMHRHFSYSFFFLPARPHDWQVLAEDREFSSILQTTHEIMDWKRRRTEILLERAEHLLEAIREELPVG
jgi:hypothetical protein